LHALDPLDQTRIEEGSELPERGLQRGLKGLAPSRSARSRVASKATISASERGTGRRPVARVVDRKAGGLENLQVSPDGPDGAPQFPGGLVDGEPLWPPEEVEEPPLAPELVSPRHGVRGFCGEGGALSMRGLSTH
jgi:hypothetical protein